jgi:hypothetical protein
MPLSARVDTITPLSIITSQEKARLPESVAGLFRLNLFERYAIVSYSKIGKYLEWLSWIMRERMADCEMPG